MFMAYFVINIIIDNSTKSNELINTINNNIKSNKVLN